MDRTCLLSPPSRSRQNMEQTAFARLEGGVGVATPIVAPPAPCSTEVVAAQIIEEGEIKKIANEIFALRTGISNDEIRKIIRIRISSKIMTLDQQVAAGEKVIKRLKHTLTAMTKAKNEFVNRAIFAERSMKADLTRASEVIQCLEEKLTHLDAENIIWKDEAEGTTRELCLSDDRAQNLRTENRELKEKLRKAEDAEKQALVGLGVEKARSRENEKRAQEWQTKIIQNQEDEMKELKRELHEAKHASTQAAIALELEKQCKEREKPRLCRNRLSEDVRKRLAEDSSSSEDEYVEEDHIDEEQDTDDEKEISKGSVLKGDDVEKKKMGSKKDGKKKKKKRSKSKRKYSSSSSDDDDSSYERRRRRKKRKKSEREERKEKKSQKKQKKTKAKDDERQEKKKKSR